VVIAGAEERPILSTVSVSDTEQKAGDRCAKRSHGGDARSSSS